MGGIASNNLRYNIYDPEPNWKGFLLGIPYPPLKEKFLTYNIYLNVVNTVSTTINKVVNPRFLPEHSKRERNLLAPKSKHYKHYLLSYSKTVTLKVANK